MKLLVVHLAMVAVALSFVGSGSASGRISDPSIGSSSGSQHVCPIVGRFGIVLWTRC